MDKFIEVGILDTDAHSLLYLDKSTVKPVFVNAPKRLQLKSIKLKNYSSRQSNEYTFNFIVNTLLPSNSNFGKIYIDFPKQYYIPDSPYLTVQSLSSTWVASGTTLGSSIQNNRVIVDSGTSDYTISSSNKDTQLSVVVKNVFNPTLNTQADNYFIQITNANTK